VVSAAGSELGQLQGQLELRHPSIYRPGFPEHHHRGIPTKGRRGVVVVEASLALSALLQQLLVVAVIWLLYTWEPRVAHHNGGCEVSAMVAMRQLRQPSPLPQLLPQLRQPSPLWPCGWAWPAFS
jgi:hypothetical protein